MGPNPLSSSRTMTLATKAVLTNMKNTAMIISVMARLSGAFLWTLELWSPMEISLLAMAPKVSRKNSTTTAQNTGLRKW